MELFSQPKKMRGRAAPIKELGIYPATKEAVQVFTGKYGPYIKVGAQNVSLPEDMKIEDLTLEAVLPLVKEKLATAKKVKRTRKTAS